MPEAGAPKRDLHRVSVPGSGQAFTTMLGYDLDNPLRVDDCDRCGAVHWRDCICDPSRPNHQPTAAEIEAARQARLTRAEGEKGTA